MTFKLKQPAIYDYSSWEYPIKLTDTNPNPTAVIFRASLQELGSRVRYEDKNVDEFVSQAKAVGIKYGLYHFLTVGGIAEQAALFLGVWNRNGGADLAPIVDVEVDLQVTYKGAYGNAVWQSNIKTFLDLIAAGTGRTPIIYTNRNFWSFVMTKNPTFPYQLVPPVWTADYYLWHAQYPNNPDLVNAPALVDLPTGWTKWAMWQYASNGRGNGFVANDLNIASDWYALEIGAPVTPPPPPPPTTNQPKLIGATFYFDDNTSQDMIPKV